MATNKPAATSAKSTVKKLSEKMNSEKAIQFLMNERKQKEAGGLKLFQEFAKKLDAAGCSLRVSVELDNENRVIPKMVITAK